jgi:hypothetical protein
MEVSGQLHAPVALPQRKSRRYPLGRRLGGPHSQSGGGGEVINSQPLPGFKPPIIQPVAQRYTIDIQPGTLKGKGKVVPVLFLTEHHAMKAYWGSGGIAPLILWPRH